MIGGAIASQGYYGGPGYYAPGQGYYDDQYYDDGSGAVAVAPAPGGDDAVAYCMQTYRSYDPRSGTYLGNDGYRHPARDRLPVIAFAIFENEDGAARCAVLFVSRPVAHRVDVINRANVSSGLGYRSPIMHSIVQTHRPISALIVTDG